MKPTDRVVMQGLATEPAEGMARVIGQWGFKHSEEAVLCWHCKGDKVCSCALCTKGKCGVCLGSGLLTWGDDD